jgi:hypothetical protein
MDIRGFLRTILWQNRGSTPLASTIFNHTAGRLIVSRVERLSRDPAQDEEIHIKRLHACDWQARLVVLADAADHRRTKPRHWRIGSIKPSVFWTWLLAMSSRCCGRTGIWWNCLKIWGRFRSRSPIVKRPHRIFMRMSRFHRELTPHPPFSATSRPPVGCADDFI